MEVRRQSGIKSQAGSANLADGPAANWQHHPLLGRRIAHGIEERPVPLAVTRTRLPTAAEEKAIAAVQGDDVAAADGQEGERGVDERNPFPGDVGEVVSRARVTLAAEALVEEANQGLGQLLAVVGVGDEVAPGPGDALEAAHRADGEAAEDLH